jgi:DNA-binding NarL/FixJ family response regulator
VSGAATSGSGAASGASGAAPPVRVAIVDDQTLVRQGIRSLLDLADDVEVVAEAADGDEALELLDGCGADGDGAQGGTGVGDRAEGDPAEGDPAEECEVDVLLLDLRMPRRDGIATLEALRDRGVRVPVLVLTTFDDDELVLKALRAGARGYLLKDVTLAQLTGAIHTLAHGGTLLQPALTDRLLRAIAAHPTDVDGLPGPEPLTARERDVLRLVAAGYANREIADALHLAEGTVKNHVSNVLLKLGVRDRTRAVLRALDLGLLTPTDAPD